MDKHNNSKNDQHKEQEEEEEDDDDQSKCNWVDITSLIQDCAASLSFSNPTLHNADSFSLHDTMAALELMDPKMDCCELRADLIHPSNNNPPNVIIPPRPIPTSLYESPLLPWDELTLQDATNVSLEILTRLESLLCRSWVAECTYNCLYAQDIGNIHQAKRSCIDDPLSRRRLLGCCIIAGRGG